MITTTLNKIRSHGPCKEGWQELLRHLGKTQADDEPLPLETVLNSNGLGDALWCLRAVENHDREIRLYAVWCARQVQHLMTDPRSVSALDVAERYARGQASAKELWAARETAWAAVEEAATLSEAAAWAAAWAGAAGARETAAVVLWQAGEARAAAAREAQAAEFRRMCREGYP